MSTEMNCCEVNQWSPMSEQPLKFIPVNLESDTGRNIVARFNSSGYSLEIISVDRIENPYLMTAYTLKKQELAAATNEQLLFHGTTAKNLLMIAQDNFDWRLCKGHLYGAGVSFSNNAWYASYYSDKNVVLKEMLLARVMVTKTAIGSNCMVIPPDGCDATTRDNGKVIVKYDDDTFYPEFRIKYYKN